MTYREWSELYFPAFYYALGKSDDSAGVAAEFASWYVEQFKRDVIECFAIWKEIQDEANAEKKLDAYIKGDPRA